MFSILDGDNFGEITDVEFVAFIQNLCQDHFEDNGVHEEAYKRITSAQCCPRRELQILYHFQLQLMSILKFILCLL